MGGRMTHPTPLTDESSRIRGSGPGVPIFVVGALAVMVAGILLVPNLIRTFDRYRATSVAEEIHAVVSELGGASPLAHDWDCSDGTPESRFELAGAGVDEVAERLATIGFERQTTGARVSYLVRPRTDSLDADQVQVSKAVGGVEVSVGVADIDGLCSLPVLVDP